MSAQVDHDLLADFLGGALDGTLKAAEVAALIATSSHWRQAADNLTAALDSVSQDLDLLRGTEERMPPDIAMRFDELFASAQFVTVPAPAAIDPLGARVLTANTRRRALRRRLAAPAAIAACLLAVLAGVTQLPALTGIFSRSASAPEAALENAPANDSSHRGLALNIPVTTSVSGRLYTRLSFSAIRNAESAPPTSMSDYGLGNPTTGEVPLALQRLYAAAPLQACLAAVAEVMPGQATSVDFASFEGRSALVISTTNGTSHWIFVAGPDCGVSGADEIFRTPLK